MISLLIYVFDNCVRHCAFLTPTALQQDINSLSTSSHHCHQQLQ